MTKAELRKEIKSRLNAISVGALSAHSTTVVKTLREEQSICLENVVAYASIQQEIQLERFINDFCEQTDSRLALPRFNKIREEYEIVEISEPKTDLIPSYYGILEPRPELSAMAFDLYSEFTWLIPGLAFSPNGMRLGRGKGYYDRLLKNIKGKKVALAHDCQIMENLPFEQHDIQMDFVITEKALYGH